MVSEAAAQNLVVYREGIKQKLNKAGSLFKEDYIQATQDVRSRSIRSARSFAKQAQAATEQAKERAQALAEQAKERVQTLNEQLKEGTQTLTQQAKEKGQTLVEQLKEETKTIGEQLKEETQTTEQVKEKLDPVIKKSNVSPTDSSTPTSNPRKTTSTAPEDDDEPWI